MMLMISPEDFQRLSPECRQELIALLSSRDVALSDEDVSSSWGGPGHGDHHRREPDDSTNDEGFDKKRVVSIKIKQAEELVAKFSDKTKATLKLFALGAPLSPEELWGQNRRYEDKPAFKRTFVGAVNRRLRNTVWKGKEDRPVLFSSNEDETRISVKPLTAAALRQALQVAEPMPTFEFFDKASGVCLLADSDDAHKLREMLELAWKDFSGRPEYGQYRISEENSLKHFIDHGFQASVATTIGWNEDSENPVYGFESPQSSPQLRARLGVPFNNVGESEHYKEYESLELFLSHEDMPGVMAGPLKVSLPQAG